MITSIEILTAVNRLESEIAANRNYTNRAKSPSHDQPLHHTAPVGVSGKLHKPEAADQGRTLNGQRVQPAASTIAELCRAIRVRRGTSYNLQRRGEAPSVVRPARQVLTLSGAVVDSLRCNEALAAALSTGVRSVTAPHSEIFTAKPPPTASEGPRTRSSR